MRFFAINRSEMRNSMRINVRKAEEMFRQFNQERRQYFEDAKEENAGLNLRLLKKINMFLIPFLFFSLLITPLIVPGWHISVPYFLFVPVICGFSFFSVLVKFVHVFLFCFSFPICPNIFVPNCRSFLKKS